LKTEKKSNEGFVFIMLIILISIALDDASTKEDGLPKKRKKNKLIPFLEFERLLFIKNKEEILGDLYEEREILLADGLPEKQVNRTLFKKKVAIIFFQYLGRIQEWFEKQLEVIK